MTKIYGDMWECDGDDWVVKFRGRLVATGCGKVVSTWTDRPGHTVVKMDGGTVLDITAKDFQSRSPRPEPLKMEGHR